MTVLPEPQHCRLAQTPNPVLNPSAASEAATKSNGTTDERRWTQIEPVSNSNTASPGVALDDGLQDPDGLRTEAGKRNNVAKTTILYACSTENLEGTEREHRLHPTLCSLSALW
jgi:hypothetical protein